mgnify:CR=1 FL=1
MTGQRWPLVGASERQAAVWRRRPAIHHESSWFALVAAAAAPLAALAPDWRLARGRLRRRPPSSAWIASNEARAGASLPSQPFAAPCRRADYIWPDIWCACNRTLGLGSRLCGCQLCELGWPASREFGRVEADATSMQMGANSNRAAGPPSWRPPHSRCTQASGASIHQPAAATTTTTAATTDARPSLAIAEIGGPNLADKRPVEEINCLAP